VPPLGKLLRRERGSVVAKAASKKPASGAKTAQSTKPAGKPKAAKRAAKPAVAGRGNAKASPKPASKRSPAPAKAKARPEPAPPVRAEVQRRRLPANNNKGGPIAAPVPTNDKPRKNQAGLNARELERFRDLLLAKRREILGDMSSMEREALRSSGGSNLSTLPIHMADMGTDNYEQEFTLGLVETERKLLREINNALAKIQNGSYGLCEGTNQPINKARLEVQPWARYGIEYAKRMERRGR
jgi:DnaK suppressor protein